MPMIPIEQVRIANSYRFGRHTEKLEAIDGQLSFFDEADIIYDDTLTEPTADEVLPPKVHRKKIKGQREADLKDFPEEALPPYSISETELDAFYGRGNWKRMPDEVYRKLRHEPESWTVEVHTVEVYVGTDGDHQDEFLRGNRPKDLLRGSIVTPSLRASILNVKYVTNANCWAHARRDYADAVKAADKKEPSAVRRSAAYQALSRIALIYKLEEALKDLTPEERLQERQTSIKPLVEEYFTWVKQQLEENSVPPKSKTVEGLRRKPRR